MALTQKQPDISYHPDFEKYQLRTERLKDLRQSTTELPEGFPKKLTGPLVWEGKDFTDEKEWTFSLNESHLEEIHKALLHFQCTSFQSPATQYLIRRFEILNNHFSTKQTNGPHQPNHLPPPHSLPTPPPAS
jgi:hypothetical protein